MYRFVLVLLFACDAGLTSPAAPRPDPPVAPSSSPPAAPVPEAPPPATGSLSPTPDGAGGWYAIVEVKNTYQECSNAGGEHADLVVVGATGKVPHTAVLGHHMAMLGLWRGERLIAQIHTAPGEAPGMAGWCIPRRSYDGEITRRMRLAGDGSAQLAALARDGWPVPAGTD